MLLPSHIRSRTGATPTCGKLVSMHTMHDACSCMLHAGHLLGGAGAVEAVATIKAIQTGTLTRMREQAGRQARSRLRNAGLPISALGGCMGSHHDLCCSAVLPLGREMCLCSSPCVHPLPYHVAWRTYSGMPSTPLLLPPGAGAGWVHPSINLATPEAGVDPLRVVAGTKQQHKVR